MLHSAVNFWEVRYTYPQADIPALADLTLQLPEGELIVVVGPSGAGKSTLLRLVNGLAPHFSGGELHGSVRVLGLDPVAATPKVMSRHVGFVFQDPETQFVMDQVEDEIAFALENSGMSRQEMRIRVEETLDLLDLAPMRNRRLDTLSGGERQRVAIASALALRPRILALDEPTSQLDPKSAEDVLSALVRLNSDLGLTVLLVEHRLERVLPFADGLVYLPENGPPVFDDPRTLLAQIELGPPLVRLGKALGWEPLPLTVKEGLRQSRRQSYRLAASATSEQSKPERSSGLHPATKSPNKATARDTHPLLATESLQAGYGDCPVLKDVNFQVQSGEIVVLLGRNGSGKTTLLKSLVGLIRPMRGQIKLHNQSIQGQNVADICRQIGYLPQDPNQLLFADTVAEEMEITLRNHGYAPNGGIPEAGTAAQARSPMNPNELLAQLGLAHKADAYPRDLSAGERQRAALAAILVTRPQALLLDEPTRGLDYGAKAKLAALLRTWRDEGMAIVIVTHDVELAAEVADRAVLMSQGEIIADGAPQAILGSSPLFASQVARLFPDTGWLTVEDALPSLVAKD